MCWPSAERGLLRVANLDPATYRRHALHGEDRAWAETNCFTDLVIELTHGLGHEPLAMLPFTLAIDFEGDQWTFFKPAADDLRALYGSDLQIVYAGVCPPTGSAEVDAGITFADLEQLFKLRFQRATGRVENPMKMRQVRREIAQIETLLNERARTA